MKIPSLVKSSRSREYNNYSFSERADVVKAYLFDGMSHRQLDERVLKLDQEYSRGYQSMGILHHIGLINNHKSLFCGMTVQAAINELITADAAQFAEVIDILSSLT